MEFLLPPRNRYTPLFYGLPLFYWLPKIRKPNCPLCPIFSECDGPTARLSFYITHFIQHLATILPSHNKDTIYFLNLIEHRPPLPMHSWSQLMSCPNTQTFNVMMAYQLSFISWRNKSISYPQKAHLPI